MAEMVTKKPLFQGNESVCRNLTNEVASFELWPIEISIDVGRKDHLSHSFLLLTVAQIVTKECHLVAIQLGYIPTRRIGSSIFFSEFTLFTA